MATTGSMKEKMNSITGFTIDVPKGPEAATIHEGEKPAADNLDTFD